MGLSRRLIAFAEGEEVKLEVEEAAAGAAARTAGNGIPGINASGNAFAARADAVVEDVDESERKSKTSLH